MDREDCFNECIDKHLPMLRSVAYRIVGNSADADEAIQQAMVAAWKKFDSFRGEARISSWIYRIAVNESYNILRRRKREQEKLQSYAVRPPEAETDEEKLIRLEKAIANLPEMYRLAIHLGTLSGLSGNEAAEKLNCSVNTLYQRVHKAKILLREAMREDNDE